MTTKEIVDRNGSLGYYSILKSENGKYCIASPLKESSGDGRAARDWDTLEKIGIDYQGAYEGCTYLGTWNPPMHETFKPGDKVKVREDAEEWRQWAQISTSGVKHMIGRVYEVEASDGQTVTINDRYFPLQAVEPYYEETEPQETINIVAE